VTTQGGEVVAARAAVAAVTLVARNSDSAANDTFFAKERVQMAAALGLLPPGVSAFAVGRSALIPGQPYWTDAGLGARQDVKFRAPIWTYQLLFWAGRERTVNKADEVPGPIDIPVWADPATGQVVEVDVEAMIAELEPQFDLAKRIWKNEDAPLAAVRTVLKAPKQAKGLFKAIKAQVVDVVDDIKAIGDTGAPPPEAGELPTDAEFPPVEGVAYGRWVTIRGALVMDAVRPEHVDAYTTHRGVPAGRWPAVDAAWEARAAQDPRLAAWRTYHIDHLSQLGARWAGG
jgi:hypothetical protein